MGFQLCFGVIFFAVGLKEIVFIWIASLVGLIYYSIRINLWSVDASMVAPTKIPQLILL